MLARNLRSGVSLRRPERARAFMVPSCPPHVAHQEAAWRIVGDTCPHDHEDHNRAKSFVRSMERRPLPPHQPRPRLRGRASIWVPAADDTAIVELRGIDEWTQPEDAHGLDISKASDTAAREKRKMAL
jgi:hypothetical protein